MSRPRRLRRCQLSVPGSSEKMMAKSAGLDCDYVFLDLEDAVAPNAKSDARGMIVEALNKHDWKPKTLSVRINDVETEYCHDDIIEVVTGAGDKLDTIILTKAKSQNVEAEIIFPVSSEAVMGVDDDDIAVVPGVAGGEGCSTAGGCATCPFMKINDLDALSDIVEMVLSGQHEMKLKSHLPPQRLNGKTINGINAIDLGSEPILFMRHFMKEKCLPGDLVRNVTSRS